MTGDKIRCILREFYRGNTVLPSDYDSEGLAKGLGELLNGTLVALIPSPVSLLLRFDQAGFLQDAHVVRDGGLRQVDAVFDIACAKTGILADGTGTADFENLQDAAARRVGDSVQ
jgi:hypothetical protein